MTAAHAAERRLRGRRRRTMLVVDDDVSLLRMIRNLFMRHGYAVHTAPTAEEALTLAEKHRPAIAIVDLRLGGDDGIDLIAELKQLDAKMRITLLSGMVSVAGTVDAMHAGAIDVITKPVKGRELLERIERGPPNGKRRDDRPPTLERAVFEHVSRVLSDAGGNVSEAARRLNVYRNTLQRKRRKVPSR